MTDLDLLINLHLPQQRQGPGSTEATIGAAKLTGINPSQAISIADIGAGTGASTFDLAKYFINGRVTAVDFLPQFIDTLATRANSLGLSNHISPLVASMTELPFDDAQFDLIWSEGAIYNMGFNEGITAWQRFIKPNGHLVVSEITWLTDQRPQALTDYWHREYPQIATASQKIAQLEQAGYRVKGYFYLDEHCWLDNYYAPLAARHEAFVAQQGSHQALAQQIVDADKREADLYKTYKDYVSYGVYVAQRLVP